jgi:branched-chain amino acid transport system ATP-binding protein
MATEKLLEVSGLNAGYANRDVLRNVSIGLQVGSLVSIIGPNGHGKSTLLKTISGLITPTAGSVTFAGQSINGMSAPQIVAHGLIHVPQGDMLFPDMTVLENLHMGAYLTRSKSEKATRLDKVYSILPRLAERHRQLARTLSGGERRMLSIGRGLMGGGRLTMLDEPSLGLAPIVIDQIYEVIDSLRRGGHTILIVEENTMRIAEQADWLYLLDNGAITWSGSGEELLNRPEVIEVYLGS